MYLYSIGDYRLMYSLSNKFSQTGLPKVEIVVQHFTSHLIRRKKMNIFDMVEVVIFEMKIMAHTL